MRERDTVQMEEGGKKKDQRKIDGERERHVEQDRKEESKRKEAQSKFPRNTCTQLYTHRHVCSPPSKQFF